jgi:peptide-methionine (S)-S-oxide reductase
MMHIRWILALGAVLACQAADRNFPEPPPAAPETGTQTAVFAGGCFWGVEAVFEQLKGVTAAVAGYAGGEGSTAQYEKVSSGSTGHAESVRVTYDPSQISYGQLLKVFFAVAHNPTERNRQGPDWGTQYRSAIFYASDSQKNAAEAYIRVIDDARVFNKPIVTEVAPLSGFYPAEGYHQKFVQKNPGYPYVMVNDMPKLSRLRREFPELLAKR